MSLNGINAGYAATAATAIEKVQKADKATASSKESAYKSEAGATYETTVSASSKRTKNAALVAQLKADSEKRSAQMQSLVTQMFQKQGIAIGTADDMWKVLASGNFTADADTIAQAKEDISEDGYWGVNQTSDRIFHLALALSNGDEKQMEKMVKAVEKGFSLATKSGVRSCLLFQAIRTALLWDKFDNCLRKTALLPQLPICSNKSHIQAMFYGNAASY